MLEGLPMIGVHGTLERRGKNMNRSRSSLQIESLEDRCLLDAAPVQFGSADAFKQWLISQAETRYQNLFGHDFSSGNFVPPSQTTVDANVPTQAATTFSALAGGNTTFSTTNVQVAGVDEGDIVKTDGNYIYYLRDQELIIAQAWPASSLGIVSTTPLDGTPIVEYLNGSRLTVISEVNNYGYGNEANPPVDPVIRTPDGFPLIYPTWQKTEVTVYDVSQPTSPTVVQQTFMDGSYEDSREIGSVVYVVQQNYFQGLPAPAYTNFNGDSIYETQAQYLTRIAGHELDLALPHFYTKKNGVLTPSGFLTDPAQIYQPLDTDDYQMESVVTIDTTGTTPVGTVSIITSYGSTVYASPSRLYIVTPHWNVSGDQTSTIYQFDVDGAQVTLNAAGTVPGLAYSQFDLDENGADLRIATSSWNWTLQTNQNGLYILTAEEGVLTIVGKLENLISNPVPWVTQFSAIRFFGNDAYLTESGGLAGTNPVQVVDVSDPPNPHEIGVLQVPAYVTYLQPIDATHLIGIGPTGDYASLNVILLGVADPTAPVVIDQYTIAPTAGTWNWYWGTGSEALWDHHAFGYFPDQQTLTIPIYGTYTGPNWTGFQSQLWVFQVDPSKGFTLKGQVTMDSQVRRSLEIGDQLYAVAEDSIQVHPIQDPTAPGTEARIADAARFPVYYPYYATPGVVYDGPILNFDISNAAGLTATIAWGDGSTSTGTIAASATGYTVNGNHAYAQTGNYTPTVTFSRNGSSAGTLSATVNVTDTSTPIGTFLNSVYQDLLGRYADPVGVEAFGQAIANGKLTRAQVAQAIMQSVEYQTDQVNHLYQALLGRTADASGLSAFLDVLQKGGSVEQVETMILSSAEYFQHAGGTNSTFLASLYHDVLGRAIDPIGQTMFLLALNDHVTTGQVAASVLYSMESHEDMVQSIFQKTLHRSADSVGLAGFTTVLGQGKSEADVLAMILGSQEYWDRNSA
jgi:uncharacterized secreted protein with C-terminal beta-propeller domain